MGPPGHDDDGPDLEAISQMLDILILDLNQLAEAEDADWKDALTNARNYLEEASGILHHMVQKGTPK